MYFYHFTSATAYNSITSVSNTWKCEERQPQKQSWYSEQHQQGFYVTCMSPTQLSAKAGRKTGGGVSNATHVFVFNLNVTEKGLKKGSVNLQNTARSISIKHVGSPGKYCINNIGISKQEPYIAFSPEERIWSGLVEDMSRDYNNNDKVVARMIAQSPPT